jgi:YVTN family beta-propeller protein
MDLADLLGEAEQCRAFVLVKVEFGLSNAGEDSKVGAAMRLWRVLGVLVLGLAGTLGVVPDGVSAVAARPRCQATALVTNSASESVSTIDVETRAKNPTDIDVGPVPAGVAVTPDGKTAFVGHLNSGTMSTIDVKTRTKNPTDITVTSNPGFIQGGIAVTPDGKTALVNLTAGPFPAPAARCR